MLLFVIDPALKNTIGTNPPAPAGAGGGGGGAGGGGDGGGDGGGGAGGGAGAAPAPDPLIAWQLRSATIYARLALYLEGTAAMVIAGFQDEMNGVEAWTALVTRYEHRGTFGKAFLHSKLLKTKFEEKGDPDKYFGILESCQTRLGELQHEITDDMLLGIALSALPSSYKPLISVLDTLPELTYDQLKGHVRSFYQRSILHQESATDAANSKALFVKSSDSKGKRACFGCGSEEHFVAECPLNEQSGQRPSNQKKKEGTSKFTKWKSFNQDKSKQPKKKQPGVKFEPAGKKDAKSKEESALSVSHYHEGKSSEDDVSSTVNFVVDSGATTHMTSSIDLVEDMVMELGTVTVAGGRVLISKGKGKIRLEAFNAEGEVCNILLQEVLYVPDLGLNLLSVPKLLSRGANVRFGEQSSYIEAGKIIYPIERKNGLWVWMLKRRAQDLAEEGAAEEPPCALVTKEEKSKLWHGRFGHIGLGNFAKLSANESAEVPEALSGEPDCDVCELGKQTKISLPKTAERHATEPFENLHVDLLGRMDVPSIGGAEYVAVFTDEYTRYVIAKPIEVKADFISSFQRVVNEVRGLGFRVKGLRTDHGGEFISNDLKEYCQERGILQTFTGPYAPQQQGISERMNRTLTEMVRCMLIESGLPKQFWGEAFNTATYLVNRIPDEEGQSPYFKVFERHPRVKHLRVFGCQAFVQVPKGVRAKLDPKAWSGVFVGYDASNWRCYRIWDLTTSTLRLCVHVSFHENVFPMKVNEELPTAPEPTGVEVETMSQAPRLMAEVPVVAEPAPMPEFQVAEEEIPEPEEVKADVPPAMPLLPRNFNLMNLNQQAHVVEEFKAFFASQEISLAVVDGVMDDPKTVEEALRSPYAKEWIAAMEKEIDSLKRTRTWLLVPLPNGVRPIGGKWVFRTKRNEKGEIIEFKARWVAKGYSQKPGVDYLDTYAPVAKMSSIRTLLSLAATNNWELVNMDVNSAFLNSHVTEEMYVIQPEGFEEFGPDGAKLVCKMQKCLYGLKQAPRNWNAVIDAWMVSYGFQISPACRSLCVYLPC